MRIKFHKMKILLVYSPIPRNFYNREYYLPSGLLYLGAALQKNNEEVKLLDLRTFQKKELDPPEGFYESKLIETISDFKPGLIGFGGLISGNFLDILKLSKAAKKEFPEIPTIMGGVHASMYPREILENCSSLDWLILGEGEESMVQLVNMIKNNCFEFEKIDGFAFRTERGVIINLKRNYIKNLDDIPFPAYNLINLEDYYEDTSEWHNPKNLPINTEVPIISSRSCPNDCNFCMSSKLAGRGWRARSPENVVNEIEYIYREYNHRHFSFMDDNFTLSKPRVIEIFNQIKKRGLNIQFETHNGVSVNTLDEEIIDAMASAGLTRIALPIESGSDYIRNEIMKKNLCRKKILDVIRFLKERDQIYIRAFFIIGMPEETHATLMDTYNMIKEIDVDKVHLTNIIPFPGTRVFKQAVRDNLLVDLSLKDLCTSDELFQANYDRFFIKPYNLELSDLHEFRKKCDSLITKQKADLKVRVCH